MFLDFYSRQRKFICDVIAWYIGLILNISLCILNCTALITVITLTCICFKLFKFGWTRSWCCIIVPWTYIGNIIFTCWRCVCRLGFRDFVYNDIAVFVVYRNIFEYNTLCIRRKFFCRNILCVIIINSCFCFIKFCCTFQCNSRCIMEFFTQVGNFVITIRISNTITVVVPLLCNKEISCNRGIFHINHLVGRRIRSKQSCTCNVKVLVYIFISRSCFIITATVSGILTLIYMTVYFKCFLDIVSNSLPFWRSTRCSCCAVYIDIYRQVFKYMSTFIFSIIRNSLEIVVI